MPNLTAEQLAARRDFIGGSDAHNLYNFEPYGCERKLALTKAGVQPDSPASEMNPLYERGHELEPVFAAKYERMHGGPLLVLPDHNAARDVSTPAGIAVQDAYPWARVTLDRVIVRGSERLPLEIKSSWAIPFRKYRREGPGDHMIVQTQWALAVTGLDVAEIFIGWPDGWEFLRFPVQRDEGFIASLLERANALWPNVLEARRVHEAGGDVWTVLPAPLPDAAPQCGDCEFRKKCKGAEIARVNAEDFTGDVEMQDDAAFVEAARAFALAKSVEKEAKEEAAFYRSILQERMTRAGALVATVPGFRAIWKPGKKQVFDQERHEREHPACHAAYKVETTTRNFRTWSV